MTVNYFKDKTVVVTGGTGFLGRHLTKALKNKNPKIVKSLGSKDYDIRDYNKCLKAFSGADIVIHLAANVGGIGYNRDYPADLFDDNIRMAVNSLRAARKCNVEKFVGIGTVCAYPKFCTVPFKEEDLWEGYPEETNAAYGLAKKMLLVQSQAYRQQYDFNSIYLIPVNLYGPDDNFNPHSSHVIPALIKKFIDAKENNVDTVEVWGSGNATREFLYVDDAVKGIIAATEKYNDADPVNLGSSYEISIKDLANLIKKLTNYKGKIVWDYSKPDGQPRRKIDIQRAQNRFGFEAKTTFNEGLQKTINWYLNSS